MNIPGIDEALSKVYIQEMNFKTKRALRECAETLEKESKWFEEERMALLNKHGKKENGKLVQTKDESGQEVVDLENREGFAKEFTDLLETEFEISPLEMSMLEDFALNGLEWDALELIVGGE